LAVRLRLRRMGKKKQPYYRIVAIDSRAARDGKYLESLGTYNPRSEPLALDIQEERARYWLDQGAQPSDTVYTLLQRKGILLRRHLQHQAADATKVQEEVQKWESLQAVKLQRQEAASTQRKREAKAASATAEAEPPAEPAPTDGES